MEIIEVRPKRSSLRVPAGDRPARSTTCSGNVKRYVQPPRVGSFAPEKLYNPPSKPIDANTTYKLSYLDVDHFKSKCTRPNLYRPTQSLGNIAAKFSDETTNRLSFKGNWGFTKTKPLIPLRRAQSRPAPMQCTTTAQHDYVAKCIAKPEVVLPCDNIRTCTGILDDRTTVKLSYANPGPVQPVASFKPHQYYCSPEKSIETQTTQKLSYQPFRIPDREPRPWIQKSVYRSPTTSMEGTTTYSKSYLKNNGAMREKMYTPTADSIIFPKDTEFAGKTIYCESYMPCRAERSTPSVPRGNIFISDQKMSGDTTNKMSFLAVRAEKRAAIIPFRKSTIGDGPMQCETTNRHDFVAKVAPRNNVSIPSDNLRPSEKPFECETTTTLSYMDPGVPGLVRNYKPSIEYRRPSMKIDGETVNKLSYQPWAPQPKPDLPWARKASYQAPRDKMNENSVYHASYPAPGYYVEDIPTDYCRSSRELRDNSKSTSLLCLR